MCALLDAVGWAGGNFNSQFELFASLFAFSVVFSCASVFWWWYFCIYCAASTCPPLVANTPRFIIIFLNGHKSEAHNHTRARTPTQTLHQIGSFSTKFFRINRMRFCFAFTLRPVSAKRRRWCCVVLLFAVSLEFLSVMFLIYNPLQCDYDTKITDWINTIFT